MKSAELPTKDATCEEESNWILEVSSKMIIIELEWQTDLLQNFSHDSFSYKRFALRDFSVYICNVTIPTKAFKVCIEKQQ